MQFFWTWTSKAVAAASFSRTRAPLATVGARKYKTAQQNHFPSLQGLNSSWICARQLSLSTSSPGATDSPPFPPPTSFTSSVDPSDPPDLPDSPSPRASAPDTNAPLTPAQLSRAAAQSVRLACNKPFTTEAFLILKSLKASCILYASRGGPDGVITGPLTPGERAFVANAAIDFGQAVSPRLASHALLHGLLRRGMSKKAGKTLYALYRSGERIHERTARVVAMALVESDVAELRESEAVREELRAARAQVRSAMPGLVHRRDSIAAAAAVGRGARFVRAQLPPPPNPQTLRPAAKGTRMALQIMAIMRQYRHEYARKMFQQIIDACLLQGEILVVAFLFAFLVKQWQTRKALAKHMREAAEAAYPGVTKKEAEEVAASAFERVMVDSVATQAQIFPILPKDRSEWATLTLEDAPKPDRLSLLHTLWLINAVALNMSTEKLCIIRPSYEEAAQALAILAGLINDDKRLPVGGLSTFVGTLSNFPASPSVYVYVQTKGEWKLRNARAYFDEVLESLAERLTKNPPYYGEKTYVKIYNSVLNHVLCVRPSLRTGTALFRSMLSAGITPDIDSINIYLRAAAISKRPDVLSSMLRELRKKTNVTHWSSLVSSPSGDYNAERLQEPQEQPDSASHKLTGERLETKIGTSEILSALESGGKDSFIARHGKSLNRELKNVQFTLCTLDTTTLANFIAFLTAMGDPHAVLKLYSHIFPELYVRRRNLSSKVLHELYSRAVRRAAVLGPQVLTSILNAAWKAGMTGFAERVWRLALEAEHYSWDTKHIGRQDREAPQAWVLPIAAYDIMVQCYTIDARRALTLPPTQQHPADRALIEVPSNLITRTDMEEEVEHGREHDHAEDNDNSDSTGTTTLQQEEQLQQQQDRTIFYPHRMTRRWAYFMHKPNRRQCYRSGIVATSRYMAGALYWRLRASAADFEARLQAYRDAGGVVPAMGLRPATPDAVFYYGMLGLFDGWNVWIGSDWRREEKRGALAMELGMGKAKAKESVWEGSGERAGMRQYRMRKMKASTRTRMWMKTRTGSRAPTHPRHVRRVFIDLDDPVLQGVLRDMLQAGYRVPRRYRRPLRENEDSESFGATLATVADAAGVAAHRAAFRRRREGLGRSPWPLARRRERYSATYKRIKAASRVT